MGFPQARGNWSGVPFPPPGDLSDPGIKPRSPALAGGFFIAEPPVKPHIYNTRFKNSINLEKSLYHSFNLLLFFFIGGKLLCNAVLVSAVQHESIVIIFPPS